MHSVRAGAVRAMTRSVRVRVVRATTHSVRARVDKGDDVWCEGEDGEVLFGRREMQCSPAIFFLCIHICTVVYQELCNVIETCT
jgi:hypothetical protein